MSLCPGCGGVVGRDCWNPSECEWISRSMEVERARRDEQEHARYLFDQGWDQGAHDTLAELRTMLYHFGFPGHEST